VRLGTLEVAEQSVARVAGLAPFERFRRVGRNRQDERAQLFQLSPLRLRRSADPFIDGGAP